MVSAATLWPTKPDVYTLALPEQVAYSWPRNEGEVSTRNQESQSEGKEKRKKSEWCLGGKHMKLKCQQGKGGAVCFNKSHGSKIL